MDSEPWVQAFDALDCSRPWWEPWQADGASVLDSLRHGAALHDALNVNGAAAVRFVAASTLPAGTAYECHVHDTGCSPVREGLHDFFNGLVWRRFPRAKSQLNAAHVEQLARSGVSATRGPVRDAATLFDENGAVLQAPTPLWQALRSRHWRGLFVDLRPLWAQARLTIVGHALLEKLVAPRKDLTAHVWATPVPGGGAGPVDAWLADQLTAQRLAAKPFLPLPVMGIPGWDARNAEFSFYDDARVFRTAGRQEAGPTGPRTTQPTAPAPS